MPFSTEKLNIEKVRYSEKLVENGIKGNGCGLAY
jgi:hypothetical protein